MLDLEKTAGRRVWHTQKDWIQRGEPPRCEWFSYYQPLPPATNIQAKCAVVITRQRSGRQGSQGGGYIALRGDPSGEAYYYQRVPAPGHRRPSQGQAGSTAC